MKENAAKQCQALHPTAPRHRCILEKGHKGRFHRSYLRQWPVEKEPESD